MLRRLPPFLRFAISGVLAFVIDAGIVQCLVSLSAANPYLARAVSFLAAVLFTWQFNRRYTFVPPEGLAWWREGLQYLGTQVGGFALNYATYSVIVLASATVYRFPVIGVAAGSLAGMLANYFSARRLVFGATR